MRHEYLNPEFAAAMRSKNGSYTKIKHTERAEFNYIGTPRIDLSTLEMQWWVPTDFYNQRVANHKAAIQPTPPSPTGA